jgi:hypothetical protein
MKAKKGLMDEQWAKFFELVFTADTPEIQKREMRRAFYAGAQAILFRVIAAFAPETEPTEADLKVMDDLNQELNDFAKAIQEGRA